MASIALQRPAVFDIGTVFGSTFGVIGRNLLLCLALAALFAGLPSVVYWLLLLDYAGTQSVIVAATPLIYMVVSFFLTALLQAALVRLAIEDLNGRRPSFSDCMATALSLCLPVTGVAFLSILGIALGAILLIVPGILLFLRWMVAVPALVQERTGVIDSMARSAVLTRGSRWRLFLLFLILWLSAISLQFVLGIGVVLFNPILGAVLYAMLSAIVALVMAVAAAASYVELRRVKEGTSVDQLAQIFA